MLGRQAFSSLGFSFTAEKSGDLYKCPHLGYHSRLPRSLDEQLQTDHETHFFFLPFGHPSEYVGKAEPLKMMLVLQLHRKSSVGGFILSLPYIVSQ